MGKEVKDFSWIDFAIGFYLSGSIHYSIFGIDNLTTRMFTFCAGMMIGLRIVALDLKRRKKDGNN